MPRVDGSMMDGSIVLAGVVAGGGMLLEYLKCAAAFLRLLGKFLVPTAAILLLPCGFLFSAFLALRTMPTAICVILLLALQAFLWLGTKPSCAAVEILDNYVGILFANLAKYLPTKKAAATDDHNDELSWPVGVKEQVLLEYTCTCSVSGVSSETSGRVRLVQKKLGDKKISIIVREDNMTGRILLFHETPTRIDRMVNRTGLDATKFVLTFGNSAIAGKFKDAFERAQNLDLYLSKRAMDVDFIDLMLNPIVPLKVIGATAIYRGGDVEQSQLRDEVRALSKKVTVVENENATLQNENADLKKEVAALADKVTAVKNENADLKKKVTSLQNQGNQSCVVCWENTRSVLFRPCNHVCVCVDCACEEGLGENLLRECPLCRGAVEAKERVFIT